MGQQPVTVNKSRGNIHVLICCNGEMIIVFGEGYKLRYKYGKVCIAYHLSDSFTIQNGLKQGDASSALLLSFALDVQLGKSRKIRCDWNQMGHISC
jgi:hypothetical protein